MKKIILFIIFYSILSPIKAQNLVPNPSFEDTVACPNNQGQLNFATPWISPSNSSPDYFNSCSNTSTGFSLPFNHFGFQTAHSGNAYAGIIVMAIAPGLSNNYREYTQTILDTLLIKDETYCITFYVSLADTSEFAINNIGMYFSTNPIFANNYDPLPYIPQIENTNFNPLINNNVWTKISGIFVANGNEQYLTIGNFKDNSSSDTIYNHPTNIGFPLSSYYYLDDVSVIHLDADAGKDTAICKGSTIVLGRPSASGISYSWQSSNTLSDTTIAQPTANPTVTTTYYLTATLAGGCSKLDTVTITVVDLNAGTDSTFCEGDSVLIGTNPLLNVNYTWQPTLGLGTSNASQTMAAPITSTSYTLTASANGCVLNDTVSLTVLQYQTPTISAGTTATICSGDTLQLGSNYINGYSYIWLPNSAINNTTAASPFVFPNQSTLYTLTIQDTGSVYQCKNTASDSVWINVEACDPYLPNVFTPNNDGKNDVFEITDLPLKSNIHIYNRWGVLVWTSPALSITGKAVWDGRTTAGIECITGVYYYVLEIPSKKTITGYIELIR
jgi:gliding motility-associated-like protein